MNLLIALLTVLWLLSPALAREGLKGWGVFLFHDLMEDHAGTICT